MILVHSRDQLLLAGRTGKGQVF